MDKKMPKIKTGTKEWAVANVNIQIGCEHNCRYGRIAARPLEGFHKKGNRSIGYFVFGKLPSTSWTCWITSLLSCPACPFFAKEAKDG